MVVANSNVEDHVRREPDLRPGRPGRDPSAPAIVGMTAGHCQDPTRGNGISSNETNCCSLTPGSR